MVPLKSEQNIEVLRQYTLWLESQVKELGAELTKLQDAKETGKQEWLDAKLRDHLTRLQRQHFGHGREELDTDDTQVRLDRPVGHDQAKLKLHGEYPQEGTEPLSEGLKPTGPVVFTYSESITQSSKAGGLPLLVVLEIGSLGFVAIGIWLLLSNPDRSGPAVLSILFFGLCAATFAFGIYKKLRSRP